MNLPRYLLVAAFVAAPAAAQQQATPAKTTEQQARSYVASAFITGAAPAVMSDKVMVSPALRQRLDLAPDANGAAVYKAVMGVTGGKPVQVRRAAGDEIAQSEAPAPVSEQPIFAVEAGDATLIVQYDLARDNISFVGLPGAVATAAPVVAPAPPQRVAETPTIAEAPKPAAAPVPMEAPKPAMSETPKPAQVVEPQVPRVAKPVATVAAARPVQPVAPVAEQRPPLRKSGPCEIKPVMSDQDLVNCGATPR